MRRRARIFSSHTTGTEPTRGESALQQSAQSFSPPPERAALAAAGLALVVIGASMFNILPLLTAGAADKRAAFR